MNQSILIVDDEPEILRALKRSLHKEPYKVLTATSARDAIAAVNEHEVNVIVVDQNMPLMNGLELLRFVKRRHPEVGRIMLTGDADLSIAMDAINEGSVFRFFTKPCSDIDLAIGIRDCLSKQKENTHDEGLVDLVQMQSAYIRHLEDEHPGIHQVKRAESGAVEVNPSLKSAEQVLKELWGEDE